MSGKVIHDIADLLAKAKVELAEPIAILLSPLAFNGLLKETSVHVASEVLTIFGYPAGMMKDQSEAIKILTKQGIFWKWFGS